MKRREIDAKSACVLVCECKRKRASKNNKLLKEHDILNMLLNRMFLADFENNIDNAAVMCAATEPT